MLWQFRRELIAELQTKGEVVLSMPFVGHEEDFKKMGCKCIETEVDRRGINPKRDLKLLNFYRKLLKAEKPDMVITYSIKPNIYAGLACSMAGIPFCANVQGLGTAFQRKGLALFVTALYKTALRKAKTVFFENEGNVKEFLDRKIIPQEKITLLSGAGRLLFLGHCGFFRLGPCLFIRHGKPPQIIRYRIKISIAAPQQ